MNTTSHDEPMGRPPRKEMPELSWWSIASVVGSFLVYLTGQNVFFLVFGLGSEGGVGRVYLIGSIFFAGVMGAVGGFMATVLAPVVPMRHALALAALVFVTGATGLMVAVQPEAQVDPSWAVIGKLILSVGGVFAGAWALLKMRKPDPFKVAAEEAREPQDE